jgi:hypothetical protein
MNMNGLGHLRYKNNTILAINIELIDSFTLTIHSTMCLCACVFVFPLNSNVMNNQK